MTESVDDRLGWLLVLILMAIGVWLAMAVPDEGLLNPESSDLIGQLIVEAHHTCGR